MNEPSNGFELLQQLREKNGKQFQSFRSMTKFLDFKARDKGIPVYGQFELTPLCNFSCRMCYVHLDPNQMNGRNVLPVATWKDLMHQAWEAGMIHATLTGGECLAYPGFDELYLFLQDLGCNVSIMTNGYLLDDRRVRFFKQHPPAMVQVTLYGWNEDVYERVTGQRAFGTVIENTRRAIEAGVPINVNVTPSTYLGEDVFETIRLGKSLGGSFTVNAAIFDPREETGRSGKQEDPEADMYVRIYQLLNELNGIENKATDLDKLPPAGGPSHECSQCGLRCGGGRSGFVMNWKGTIIPCNRMERIHFDCMTDGFRAAWERLNREASNWPRVPECEGCPYDGFCQNCAANMLRFAGPGEQPKELCERMRYYISRGIWELPECE